MSTRIIDAIECTCESEVCGHVWVPRLENLTGKLPKQCPMCRYRGWNKSERSEVVGEVELYDDLVEP